MLRPALVWILLSCLWGSTWIAIKIGLKDLTPLWLASGRLAIGLIPLAFLTIRRRSKFPIDRRVWLLMAVTGILNFSTNHGLVFWAELHISSGLAAVLFTFLPLFGMVISHFYRRTETFTLGKLSGILLGMVGVALIFRQQLFAADALSLLACLAVLAAALGVAFSGVLIKAHGTHLDLVQLTTFQIAAGLIPLVAVAMIYEPLPKVTEISLSTWASMSHLGLFGTATGFVLANWLLKVTSVTLAQLIPIAATLVAVILGWVVLNEPMLPGSLFGGFLIFAGLLVVQWQSRRRRISIRPAMAPVCQASAE